VVKVVDRPEFAEIPPSLKETIEMEIRDQAFEALHAEAVARKDLSAPPNTLFDKMPGRVTTMLLYIATGGAIGTISCVLAIYIIRLLTTIL
jgi:hypothetical protein